MLVSYIFIPKFLIIYLREINGFDAPLNINCILTSVKRSKIVGLMLLLDLHAFLIAENWICNIFCLLSIYLFMKQELFESQSCILDLYLLLLSTMYWVSKALCKFRTQNRFSILHQCQLPLLLILASRILSTHTEILQP